MIYTYAQFKELLPELDWPVKELADNLSTIGHETEKVEEEKLNVTLTSNRNDCKDLRYLAFDLAGIFGLKTIADLITFDHAEPIKISVDDINKTLGSAITFEELRQLERLGFIVTTEGVQAPDFRDISTKADIAEEVVRLIGYQKLAIKPISKQEGPASNDYQQRLNLKAALLALNLTETTTPSFASEGQLELKNAFSKDEPFLRINLLNGLLKTLARNPYLKRAAFYELGHVFEPEEKSCLGIILAGYKNTDVWQHQIEEAIGQKIELTPVEPARCQQFDVTQGRVYWAQLPLESLKPTAVTRPTVFDQPLPKFKPISKYPPLVRDITINQPIGEISNFPELLFFEDIDLYTNSETGQISHTVRLIFQKMGGSFTDTEIKEIDQKIEQHFFKS